MTAEKCAVCVVERYCEWNFMGFGSTTVRIAKNAINSLSRPSWKNACTLVRRTLRRSLYSKIIGEIKLILGLNVKDSDAVIDRSMFMFNVWIRGLEEVPE